LLKCFQVKRGLDVTLSKSKEGQLQVKSIEFYAKSPDKKVTDLVKLVLKSILHKIPFLGFN
jgi:hypothetical protein